MEADAANATEVKAPHGKTLPVVIAVIAVLVVIGLIVAYLNSKGMFSGSSTTGSNGQQATANKSTTTMSANSSTNLTQVAQCLNLDLRIRASSYLNNSQVQHDIAYCQQYNNTTLCTYIKDCMNGSTS